MAEIVTRLLGNGLARGVLAVPVFLVYAYLVFRLMAGVEDEPGALAIALVGALAAGYLVRSWWALLVAAPFAVFGVTNLDDQTLLETDNGSGVVILLMLALPTAVAAGLGVLARAARGGDNPEDDS